MFPAIKFGNRKKAFTGKVEVNGSDLSRRSQSQGNYKKKLKNEVFGGTWASSEQDESWVVWPEKIEWTAIKRSE